jgi:hypothetical protein
MYVYVFIKLKIALKAELPWLKAERDGNYGKFPQNYKG